MPGCKERMRGRIRDNHMNSLASQTIALDDFVLPDE